MHCNGDHADGKLNHILASLEALILIYVYAQPFALLHHATPSGDSIHLKTTSPGREVRGRCVCQGDRLCAPAHTFLNGPTEGRWPTSGTRKRQVWQVTLGKGSTWGCVSSLCCPRGEQSHKPFIEFQEPVPGSLSVPPNCGGWRANL